jgi:O-antigen/teichoic acid export membrane protein
VTALGITAGAAVNRHRGALAMLGRLGWGVADQAVSSLSNFALGLFVARTFGAANFGVFTLAFVSYAVVLNAGRGLATDPLLVRHSGSVRRVWRQATSSATGTALGVGTASGLVSVLAGLALPAPIGPVFVALGVGLPGILVQDAWRFAFFAGRRPASALLNDLVWSLLLVGGLLVLYRSGDASVAGCMLVFGLTAWIAAVFGALQAGVLPRPRMAPGWLRRHRDLSVRYLVENLSFAGASQLRSFVVGAVVGLAAVGAVRSAELLMGPFVVVLMGVAQVAVPETSRVFHASPGRLPRFCLLLGGAQAAAAVLWGAALLLVMPLGPGALLLKQLWTPTAVLLVPTTLTIATACFSIAATAGLRAAGATRRSTRAQLIASAIYLAGGAGGAFLGGAAGTCWGTAAANLVGIAVWWHQLRAALAESPGPGRSSQS